MAVSSRSAELNSDVKVVRLLTEYLSEPLGIDNPTPRFSWQIASNRRGTEQTAYQIQVASDRFLLESGKPDMWDSGKVRSSAQTAVSYQGKPLESRRAYYWRVSVWDERDKPSEFSDVGTFEMAFLDSNDWKAKWIGLDEPTEFAPMFRKEFDLAKPVKLARAYVTGLGYYELWINGKRVGDRVLDPPYTNFHKRVYYSVYDITRLIKKGRNCVAAMVGRGWWQKGPRLLVQLEVMHADGAYIVITTDENWRWWPGPITENSIYNGETYDARLEQEGWNQPGFDDNAWKPVQLLEMPGVQLSVQTIQPIKVVQTMRPKSANEVKPGVWVFDLGQNFSGWCRLRVSAPEGTIVTLKHAEVLYPDGTVNQENLRTARATDTYITKGQGEEVYEPRFTYHGFRYVQLEGYPGRPTLDTLRGCVVHTSIEPHGEFSCSNRLINKIQSACVWGERTNFHAVPTDCPQRDERQGWMGDAQVSAYAMLYNFNMPPAYSKFLRDIKDAQGEDGSIPDTVPHVWGTNPGDPMWSAAYPVILWLTYLHTGDKTLLEEHYEGVKRYVDSLRREVGETYILTRNNYGDWIAIVETPRDLISTGAFIWVTDILVLIAEQLGRTDDAKLYRDVKQKAAEAFNRMFFNPETLSYGNGSQLSNALPLALGVVPLEHKNAVLEHIVNDVKSRKGHLSTGFVGTPFLMKVLTDNNLAELAYTIATREDYPGWGYMIKMGATTIWELWKYEVGPGMNSHNHPALGFVSGWFYEALAGLAPTILAPGWNRAVVKPHVVGDLKWARARIQTVRGVFTSDWKRTEDGIILSVSVPANAAAEVFVPKIGKNNCRVDEGERTIWQDGVFVPGEGITAGSDAGQWVRFEVGSGDYKFVLR
ncbi:MAG: family 78 glycoside hydrolase catalytic domain [Armatimonadota bacterium]|nr:family 78 glycoside hydrolase catalytic domain [Armatimonadota bacterium]